MERSVEVTSPNNASRNLTASVVAVEVTSEMLADVTGPKYENIGTQIDLTDHEAFVMEHWHTYSWKQQQKHRKKGYKQ